MRIRYEPLTMEGELLVRDQIAKVEASKRRAVNEYDKEIDRLRRMIAMRKVPQTTGGP